MLLQRREDDRTRPRMEQGSAQVAANGDERGRGVRGSRFGPPSPRLWRAAFAARLVSRSLGEGWKKCLLLFRGKRLSDQGVMWNSCLLLYTGSKRPTVENQGLSRKNVYFYILLHTFHVGHGGVSFRFNELSETDA